MKHFIASTLHPSAYHGRGKKPPFFEGWYYKLVDRTGGQTWAIIPGIYRGVDPQLTHSFVMVLDGARRELTVERYEAQQFRALERELGLQIGPNQFAAQWLTLNLPSLSGHLRFHNVRPWPVTLSSPGIMGWYAWMPFMECYHGVVSLDHQIMGALQRDGEAIDFSGGRGYTEKDWGRNFPQTWIWLQANCFERVGVSLTCSIARIPFQGIVFPGFIIGLLLDGRLYRFTTYSGGRLEHVAVDETHVRVVVSNRSHRLHIAAQRAAYTVLLGPTADRGMAPFVKESLDADVTLRLSTRDGKTLFSGQSGSGGLEIEGEIGMLLK